MAAHQQTLEFAAKSNLALMTRLILTACFGLLTSQPAAALDQVSLEMEASIPVRRLLRGT
jgi:hypothetical protein